MGVDWIISDIDGCLSPEDSEPWDLPEFTAFARRVRDANAGVGPLAPLTLCTGRPQPYVEVLMKLLDIRAPVIAENGAVVYTLHDNRARYGPGITEEKILGLRAVRAYIETELLPDLPEAVIQFGKEAQLSIFSRDTSQFDSLRGHIERFAEREGGPALHITPTHFYLNISLADVDKGTALRQLMRELNVSRAGAAGIGDTVGDLPLRDAVGFFACPANAHDAVRRVADYVSPHPMLAGVMDILDHPAFRRS